MVIAAGHTIVEPQQRESYLAGCMSVVEQARGIAGCLDFAITADPLDPGRVNNFDRWESQAALEAFRGSSPSGMQAAAMLAVVGGRLRHRRRAALIRVNGQAPRRGLVKKGGS